jgi:hypothetical protein
VVIYLTVERTTIHLAAADRDAIRQIRERYGLSTDSDAIRLALRILAASQTVTIIQAERRAVGREVKKRADEEGLS